MIELKNVTKRHGDRVVLDAVSLRLETREVALLRGPSGCGKTTLLRLIAGLASPDAGEIWLHGALARGPEAVPPYRRNLAYVFQEPRLWPHMTVRQNVMFGLSALPLARRAERLELVARRTGVADFLSRHPSELSVGQSRRVALARALAPGRPLVLMDEPLTNLDAEGRRDLIEGIRQFWAEDGFTLLYVTHEASEELPFSNRTFRIEDAKLSSQD